MSPGVAHSRLTLVGLDNGVTVKAQFNPREIGIDKSVPWQVAPTSTGDQPELTFSSAEGRRMSFELLFDTFDLGTDVDAAHVAALMQLAMIMDPGGPEDRKRPTRVRVVWGSMPDFEGVIESVNVKYTMFLPDGTPVRAVCSVTLREASRVGRA
jgi:hypothetical protein